MGFEDDELFRETMPSEDKSSEDESPEDEIEQIRRQAGQSAAATSQYHNAREADADHGAQCDSSAPSDLEDK